jgi:nucleotide-binding universal stress UspA family protein
MFRKILVAVDGSRHSSRALEFADDLSRIYKTPLLVLHAFPHVSDLLGTPQYERMLESRALIGEQVHASARAQLSERTPVETHLIEGPPAPAILRVAVEESCDLIVIGSRGHGQLAGILLGSVSNVVAQRAVCPVLIVH